MTEIFSESEKKQIHEIIDNYIEDLTQEFEIRLGIWKKQRGKKLEFSPEITKEKYDELFDSSLIKHSDKEEITATIYTDSNYRKIIHLDKDLKQITKGSIEFSQKLSIKKENLNDKNTRFALSKEIPINEEQFGKSEIRLFKIRYRYSRLSKDGNWRYDFAKIMTLHILKQDLQKIEAKNKIDNWKQEIKEKKKEKLDMN